MACNQPQAHPDRCGCEPEAPIGYVSGERFNAEHERLRECRRERDALRAELSAIKGQACEHKRQHWNLQGGGHCDDCGAPVGTSVETRPPVVAEAELVSRNWTEDFDHENGTYTCLCFDCHNEFIGHKRRMICKACSTAAPPASGAVPVRPELLCKLVEEGCIGSVTDAEWVELRALLAKGGAIVSACPKCTSTDLVTRYIPRGHLINHSGRQKVDNEFVTSNEYDFFWQIKAAKEHLHKHCRNCQYGWRENVAEVPK